jgi:hypothetical protein
VFSALPIGSSISEFNAFGLVALEPIELQNYRVLESYIKKKIQYSLLNNIDKEDKTSAYFQAKNIELTLPIIAVLVLLSKSSTKPDMEEIESPKLSNSIFNKLDILKSFLALVLV